ncbi:hypothetical protein KC340_g6869 [Hortaea werneckii]|nr:hypothetical protein KC342_g7127 [Hortaea werneckii]KAI7098002.1 hypothetical protein KC339_g9301 [Hortaea werneckii]KAI7215785.1 hypothetical protein KC365_g13462 [Hortaea werneckii]KAI7322866.1 hypothetical protein KC340_g6869 [Hortaea werneckii]
MAWWQKKLLHYALSRTGLLDDRAIRPENLDITLGRQNVVELKDVGLNIRRISTLAQLPPSLRVETARVLSLRLTVPADIYQSSIVAELDGIELRARSENDVDVAKPQSSSKKPRRSTRAGSPQHRKVHRRIHSPPPYDPGGQSGTDEDAHFPTTEEMARSFLQGEPAQERRELEAEVTSDKGLEESMLSESSATSDVGTGAGMGLPGFLAGFLQGIVDRLKVHIKNVEVRLSTEIADDIQGSIPVTLRLRLGTVDVASLDTEQKDDRRHIKLQDISVDLLSEAGIFSGLSELPIRPSTSSKRSNKDSTSIHIQPPSSPRPSASQTHLSAESDTMTEERPTAPDEALLVDVNVSGRDISHDVARSQREPVLRSSMEDSDHDIQLGDDNISWASRRSKSSSSGLAENLWDSMASDDDLPDSMLLKRASTPRMFASRDASPVATRSRRAVSPYDRSIRSPGSWPRADDSPERHRAHASPGSWPNLDQSQQSLSQPLSSDIEAGSSESLMDNKRTALEESYHSSREGEYASLASEDEGNDAMTQSRFYSHEEAESMYMSAMTQSPKMHIPGGWGAESHQSELSPPANEQNFQPTGGSMIKEQDVNMAFERHNGNVTPRAQSPELSRSSRQVEEAAKRLVAVDEVSLWLPATKPEETPVSDSRPGRQHRDPISVRTSPRNVPGAFSIYSEMGQSHKQSTPSAAEGTSSMLLPTGKSSRQLGNSFEAEIGVVTCSIDISACRLLYGFGMAMTTSFSKPSSAAAKSTSDSSRDMASCIGIRSLTLALFEELPLVDAETSDVGLLALTGQDISLEVNSSEVDLRIGRLKALLSGSELLVFDRTSKLSSSIVLTETTPDIAIMLKTTKTATRKRPVTDLAIETLPAKLELDLSAIDDTLSSFGGLSGVLELSGSVLSEGGNVTSPVSKPPKGVRFEGDLRSNSLGPELKVNVRVGGSEITLRGEACALNLRTTTLKAIYREQGAIATVEHVILAGPLISHAAETPVTIDLTTVRLEYLLSPGDKDLERLLSLLTPSKDKYDTDDDILLDTLIRQRKKGGLLRAAIGSTKVKISSLDFFSTLSSLGDELSKLAAVAKYLPEDDRPGLLTLVRVKELQAQLPVNERFGKVQSVCSDLHLAHVGLPALLAFSIDTIRASRMEHSELVHPLIPLMGADNLPMLMARMLGDEAEPTVKVKIFNTCVEYSVPIILALTSVDLEAPPAEVVAEMAKSFANVAIPQGESESAPPGSVPSPRKPAKKTNVTLLVHDSALGLKPQNSPAKGLLVLTDARFSTLVPLDSSVKASLELSKAALFITDDSENSEVDAALPRRGTSSNTSTDLRVATALSNQGYTSVASIMAARIDAKVEDNKDATSKSVDVDVYNQLVLLETCADSTKTLFAILGGLAPPTPPSRQPKYLTEPMTIEDMMASFTGEPETKPQEQPETLFDADESHGQDEPDALLDAPFVDDETDNLLMESEMTQSLYGPVSGILGEPEEQSEEEDVNLTGMGGTVESLLEEDPFEMPSSPDETGMGDAALMRDLQRQCAPPDSDEPIDLGLYEIEDLGFDALGTGQQPLGSRNRFNTPASRGRVVQRDIKRNLPFRLSLHDIHLIWNLHDGYDWQSTREGIASAVEQVEARAEERKVRRRQSLQDHDDEEESIIGDVLFNSIYIGVPANHDVQDLRRQINRGIDDLASEDESVPLSGTPRPTTQSVTGRQTRQRPRKRLKLERSRSHKVAFELKGVYADLLVFPPDESDAVSSMDFRVKDFEIFDNVPTSTWRKFLTRLHNSPATREMARPMAHIELMNVKTLENYAASEMVIHAALMPLRLHVDQDALDFIVRFFNFKDESTPDDSTEAEQPFIQRLEVDTVDVRLDYKPKRIDYGVLRAGNTSELMNIINLEATDIKLRHTIVYGLRGFAPLHKTLNDIWTPDVIRNQLPTVLSGLAPVRSLANIGAGMRDVVAIPVREYKKDGRLVRSIQKGALQFGRTTTSELARLGAKLAMGTQNLLTGAEGLLSPSAASPSGRHDSGRHLSSGQGWHDNDAGEEEQHEQRPAVSAYANQPLGVFAGLRSARRYLEHDLLTARDAFIAVQGEILESNNPGSLAAAVVRGAPTVMLRPVIGASRAVGTALLGVGNQIDRDQVRRAEDKYKHR